MKRKIFTWFLLITTTALLGVSAFVVRHDTVPAPQQSAGGAQADQSNLQQGSEAPTGNQGSPYTNQDQQTKTAQTGNHSRQEHSSIVTANPNAPQYRYYLLNTPTDPTYSSNWGQQKIQANRAWDATTGSASTIVAVIDSPFALAHEDLSTRWYQNNGEVGTTTNQDACWSGTPANKATNGCDDDANGYVDDWRGWDFANTDNNVQAGLTNPNGQAVDHGTMVSGTIAASPNNGLGGVGLDWQAKIMPLQVFTDDGEAYTNDIVSAIQYAVDNGAQVINLSLGTTFNDTLMHTAVQYARNHGVVVVAASGNCVAVTDSFCSTSDNNPGRMLYPARFTETLAVGASNQSDTRASFSSYGPELDLVAPGLSVGPMPSYTALNATSYYETASGTSFAAPMVSGVAALLKAQNPSFTPADIEAILTTSSEKLSAMSSSYRTDEYGFGRVNAHRATLLAKAYTQSSLLGSRTLSPHEPPVGVVWRTTSGFIDADEWILIGCRVSPGKLCSATVQNSSIYRFTPDITGKSTELQYLFVKGSAIPAGTWNIAVHSDQLAGKAAMLMR